MGFIAGANVPEPEPGSSPAETGTPLTSQIAIAFSAMTLTISRLKNPTPLVLEELDTAALVPVGLDWSSSPELFQAEAGTEYYFWLESVPVVLDAGEVLFVKLSWAGTDIDTDIRIYNMRPVVQLIS